MESIQRHTLQDHKLPQVSLTLAPILKQAERKINSYKLYKKEMLEAGE